MSAKWRLRCADGLVVEEAGLSGGGDGGLTAGDADDTKDGDFAEGGAGNEDTVGIGVEIGRRDLNSVVEQTEQVIGDDALQ